MEFLAHQDQISFDTRAIMNKGDIKDRKQLKATYR